MSIVKSDADGVCSLCNAKTVEEALKCKTCSDLVHFGCSDLPDYHLARLYAHRQSTYTCRVCVAGEVKFAEMLAKVKHVQGLERQLVVTATGSNTADVGGGSGVQEESTDDIARGAAENATVDGERMDDELPAGNPIVRRLSSRRTDSQEICKLYLQKKCPKGKTGRVNGVCPFRHPKICYKFLKFGTKRGGCSETSGCSFYHPKICHQFMKRGNCTRTGCTFYHARQRIGKPRGKFIRDEESWKAGISVESAGEGPEDQPSYARVAATNPGLRPSVRRMGAQQQPSLGQACGLQAPQHSQTDVFLEMQSQMQEQIKQLSQLMQVLVSRDSCATNSSLTRQQICHCGNRS